MRIHAGGSMVASPSIKLDIGLRVGSILREKLSRKLPLSNLEF
jgi:hypothetical protein